jgi:hypothetical protein
MHCIRKRKLSKLTKGLRGVKRGSRLEQQFQGSGRMCSLQSFCKSQAIRDAAPHLTGEVTGGIANHEYEFSAQQTGMAQ